MAERNLDGGDRPPTAQCVLMIHWSKSSQTLRQVLSTWMVVTHKHARVFVTRDLGQFVHGEDGRQACSCLVAQVVKAKVGQEPFIRPQLGCFALIDVGL